MHLFNVTPAVTKPRLASVEQIKISLRDALPVDPVFDPFPSAGAIVALRAECFCALEDDCGHAVFTAVSNIIKKEVTRQMLYSMTSKTKPCILRYNGDDRFLIFFERIGDALHFLVTLQDSFFDLEWPAEFLAWGCGGSDGKLLRGIRLQSAVHWCSSVTDTGVDPFTGTRRAKISEAEFAVGLSLLARGGETLLSHAAMEARAHETSKEIDIRCRNVVILKHPKMVTFKQTQTETPFYIAMSPRFFPRQDMFRKLPPIVSVPLSAAPVGDVSIVTVGIAGAFKLVATNYPAYMDARTRLDGIAVSTAQRFGAVKCMLPDASFDIAASLFAFWSAKDALCFASHLHEVAMTGFFPAGLDDTPFTQQVLTPDDAFLFRGFRLRIGIHRSDRIHILPETSQYGGPDVAESVFLAAAASPGHTLASFEALEAIPESIKLGPELQFSALTKSGDLFGVSRPMKVNVVLPLPIAQRFPGTPLHVTDPLVESLRRLAIACKAPPKEAATTPGPPADAVPKAQPAEVAAAESPTSPAGSPLKPSTASLASSTQLYPLAQPCEDNVAFASIRIPNCAALVERSPQAMEAGLAMYLAAVRDATKGFDGYEICQDVDGVFVIFSDLVNALRWALHLNESLMTLRWPEQLLSLEAAKEVKTSGKGSTRNVLTFRGLRALVSIDYGKPNFFMDTAVGKVIYFGNVPLRAIGASQWGHPGQIVLTQSARIGLAIPELNSVDRLAQHAITSVGSRSVTDEDTVEMFLVAFASLATRHFATFPETPKSERFITLANDIAEMKRTIHSQEHTASAVFHAPQLETCIDNLQPGNAQVGEALISDLHETVVAPAARLFGGRITLTSQTAMACTFPSCQAAYVCACFINMKLLAITPAAAVPSELLESVPSIEKAIDEKFCDPDTGATLWNGIRIASTIDATVELRWACEYSGETEGGDIVLSQRALMELDLDALRPLMLRWVFHDWAGSSNITRGSLLPLCLARRSFRRSRDTFTWAANWWSSIGATTKKVVAVQDVAKSAADEQFEAILCEIDERTDAAARAEKLVELRRLWKRERLEKDELAAKLDTQRRRKEEALGQLARADTTAAIANAQLLAAHNALRIFRSKADVFINKALQEALFGTDSADFVLQFMHAVQSFSNSSTAGAGSPEKRKATKEPEISSATASVGTVTALRELFGSYSRQSIDDEGNENRSAKLPERLTASMIGHMAKLFTSLEKMAKSKERSKGGGAVSKVVMEVMQPKKPAAPGSRPVSGSIQGMARFSPEPPEK